MSLSIILTILRACLLGLIVYTVTYFIPHMPVVVTILIIVLYGFVDYYTGYSLNLAQKMSQSNDSNAEILEAIAQIKAQEPVFKQEDSDSETEPVPTPTMEGGGYASF